MDPEKFQPRDSFDTNHVTTNSGAPVDDSLNSLTLGERGPVLLSDFHLVEKLANFDREVIPERRVHARGVAAKGVFQCTHDISRYTFADPFSQVGKKTPVAVRFSTVVHSRGSPETLRDPRGFATKFYTARGNWDLVGNLEPVFFIRDAMQFPEMVHAFKPSPKTDKQEWHRILDFLSFHPECMHMMTWLLDDVGIPRNYETMNGAGVHTFIMINAQGKETYVKFHWVSEQGQHNLLDVEAKHVAGEDFSHATNHLIASIEMGNFPAWQLKIQVMDPATELDHSWGDPLDPTKTWPESEFPMIPAGRMVLNQNMDNQFLQGECIAFSPGNVIPGITFSQDKLLQGRIFSYADTQRYRLGANYLQLPINAPRCPFMNRQFDGAGNTMHRKGDINYYPSSQTKAETVGNERVPNPKRALSGTQMRRALSKQNNFGQAGERWRSFDEARRQRLVERAADALNAPKVSKSLKNVWIGYWTKCDPQLGASIAAMVKMSNM
eukprot:GFKZ01013059.1.p1 GENE.GFKZ01013059.1~~GFKZ01013059.1.p1  ORF type:complete len:495 (-),score=41.80 GFKZ01013059.1:103-1587(-)